MLSGGDDLPKDGYHKRIKSLPGPCQIVLLNRQNMYLLPDLMGGSNLGRKVLDNLSVKLL